MCFLSHEQFLIWTLINGCIFIARYMYLFPKWRFSFRKTSELIDTCSIIHVKHTTAERHSLCMADVNNNKCILITCTKYVEYYSIVTVMFVKKSWSVGWILLRISARIIISRRDYRMRCMRIVLVEQICTGCTNKWYSLLMELIFNKTLT